MKATERAGEGSEVESCAALAGTRVHFPAPTSGSSSPLVTPPSAGPDAFRLQEHSTQEHVQTRTCMCMRTHTQTYTHNKVKAVSHKAFFPLFWITQKKKHNFFFSPLLF